MGRFFNDFETGSDTLEHYGRKGMKWGKHVFGNDKKADLKFLKTATPEQAKQFSDDWIDKVWEDFQNAPDKKLHVYGKTLEPEYVQAATNKFLKNEKMTMDERIAATAFIAILIKSGKLKL